MTLIRKHRHRIYLHRKLEDAQAVIFLSTPTVSRTLLFQEVSHLF
jgi:hypothetical protein